MSTIVVMPGGFHPFHAGHAALYNSARRAFPDAEVFVAATNDTSTRPFPFAVKEKLAKLAGVEPGHFVQVKSPFRAEEITSQFNPDVDSLIFVRSEKDKTKPPQAGGNKKDGSPAYLQPLLSAKRLEPFGKHAYMAYLPTVEFGPGMTSATEIRAEWPSLDEQGKLDRVMSLYPKTQSNVKLAQTVVKLLDTAMGIEQGVAEGMDGQVVFSGTGADGGKYEIIQSSPTDFMIHANGKHIDTYSSLQRAMSVLKNEVPGLTKGVAEGSNDTIYPNAEVIKSKNGKPVGEIYQDGNSWGAFHYKADRGYDFIDSREEAIEALKDLHQETGRSRPDYTIKGVAEGSDESYMIIRTDAEGKKDVFAGNFDTYEQAQKELDACLAHPLHTKYKQKFEIKRKGGEQGAAEAVNPMTANTSGAGAGMKAGYADRENQPPMESHTVGYIQEENPDYIDEKWSQKYKSSINCANPKGFSQKAHCAGRKK